MSELALTLGQVRKTLRINLISLHSGAMDGGTLKATYNCMLSVRVHIELHISWRWPFAKNTTTIIVEWVPYGLPKAALSGVLSHYREVKSIRPITHKGYGLSKYKIEMARRQDIPSRISVQGNPINVFYKLQPRSCFVCQGAGHEAKNCPRKLANKRAAPVAQEGPPQVHKHAHQGGAAPAKAPPAHPIVALEPQMVI